MKALAFDLDKEEIFERRTSRVRSRRGWRIDGRPADQSPTDVVYRMTKSVDPNLEESLKISRKAFFKVKKKGK